MSESAKKTILVVDDEDILHKLFDRLLAKDNYTVLHNYTGEEALKTIRQNTIDLAVLDIVLPDIEGSELAKQALKIVPNLRILFSSGYESTRKVQDILDTGNAEFIPKPFTSEELLEKISKLLKLSD